MFMRPILMGRQLWEKAFGSWAPVEEREREKEREREEPWTPPPTPPPPQSTDMRLEGFMGINLEIVHLGLRTL